MAVVLSAYDLVVRVDLLPDRAAFRQAVPNRTFCTDGRIAIVSFMVAADRDRFAVGLALPAGSFARADLRTRSADADWLECGRYGGVDAVWLRGVSPEPLVVPLTWHSGAEIVFGTVKEMKEFLQFVRTEDNVDVYVDKRTGKKLYQGRVDRPPALDESEAKRLNALRAEADALLDRILLGTAPLGFFEKRKVKRANALLKEILAAVPDHWPTHWTLGMSLRRLGDEEAALEHFRSAYAAQTENPGVGREYGHQCLRLGLGEEAVRVCREIHARFPNDVGLHANLAIAILIGGEVDEALAVADAALARDPSDSITRDLQKVIVEVRAGRKPRPKRLSDL